MGRPPRSLPPTKTSSQPLPQAEDVLSASKDILAPLIRLLLATGVDYTRLAAELKPIFIEQALQELQEAGRKDTDSAISLLSGVHRKDVRKWRESRLGKSADREVSLSAQVYARWAQEPKYLDRQRRPKALPRLGPEPSFDSLARSVTQDVHPYTVLTELMRLGLVQVESRAGQEIIVPNREGFIPPPGSLELMELFGSNLTDHAAAAVANLLGSPPRLEQSVFAEGITEESAALLSALARKLWAQARAEVITQARQLYEHDRNQPEATHRMRFGVYFWDESITKHPEKSSAKEVQNESD